MPKFLMTETIHSERVDTVRLGTGTGSANEYGDAEIGKPVKLVAESRYALAAAGDPIEGVIMSIRGGRTDDYGIGGIVQRGLKEVTFDGLEATPGTGVIAVGDYVVCGTAVAKGTALAGPMKVCKATNQPGATVTSADATVGNINAAIAKVTDAQLNTMHGARVVSLGFGAGDGSVGSVGLIEIL